MGVGTTLVSSVMPAIRASRVAPLAALRESQPAEFRFSTRRTIAGAIITLAGATILLVALFGGGSNAAARVGLGAAAVFFGVAVLSPLVVRPVARFLGAPLPRLRGTSGKLGRENAIRNPKRTASTAAALMIGLGLVAFVSVFAQSIKASSDKVLQETLKADYIVSTNNFTGFSQGVAARLRSDPAFGAVTEFRQGAFGLGGHATQLQGVSADTLADTVHVDMQSGSLSNLGLADVLVYKDTAASHGWKIGSTVKAEFARTGKADLKVVGIYTDNRILGDFVVSLPTYERNFVEQLDFFVMAKTAPA